MAFDTADSSQRSNREPRSRRALGLTAGILVTVFVITWIGALRQPFVDDDWFYLNVVQQPGWWHSPAVWDPANGLYRPILYVWFGLLRSVVGLHPLPYHLATSGVVLLVGFLTWRVAIAAGLDRGALVAAGIVLLHSSVVYPVSWTSAASSPLSVAFALGAILVLLNRPVTLPRAMWAALLFAMALLTREVVIVAPAVVVVVAWARPGGEPKDALLRSLPLWVVDIGYLILREASGAGDPTGPYHQQVSAQALNNFFALIVRGSDLSGFSVRVRSLAITGLVLVMTAALVWSLAHDRYVLLGGLVWFVLGTIPVVFLVNHSMDLYYIDFALPGLALAVGAACELVAESLPDRIAVAAGIVLLATLCLVGHVVSNIEFTKSYGVDIAETQRLLPRIPTEYPHPSTGNVIVVRSARVATDMPVLTSNGDLFRVVLQDPALRVQVIP